jgi:O-6-methylguanine DNA methyltransferase
MSASHQHSSSRVRSQNLADDILASLTIRTVEGDFIASYTSKGLARLGFPASAELPSPASASAPAEIPVPDSIRLWHELTRRALEDALCGKPVSTVPPLDLRGTTFQREIWSTLRRIPAGKTMTYSELAARIGRPNAVRAAGGACGANPVPVLVPCHRVLAASRKLGGFSGGLDWKRKLLEAEGISVP